MNPFTPGDKVQYRPKNRRDGTVTAVACGECEHCKHHRYADCIDVKGKVWVQWWDKFLSKKILCKYNYKDLDFEVKPTNRLTTISSSKVKSFKGITDIKKIGEAELNVPLIVPGELEEEPQLPPVVAVKQLNHRPVFWDEFLANCDKMHHPI